MKSFELRIRFVNNNNKVLMFKFLKFNVITIVIVDQNTENQEIIVEKVSIDKVN